MNALERALLSVSDKRGLPELARVLAARGVELLSTGGTARALRAAGLVVTEVSDYTGFPQIMGGRLKTLHPRIHGGLLARLPEDEAVMTEHGIARIDLLVVNLYPFEQTLARCGTSDAEAVEQIDIGGPAMLRAAAKNHARVAVIVDPADYPRLLAALAAHAGALPEALRGELAAKAFAHTAAYDAAIARYLAERLLERGSPADRQAAADGAFPSRLELRLARREILRYGENPHQRGAVYIEADGDPGGIAHARQLQGRALSFNNLLDADTALECVRGFIEPACVIVKHSNPCGVAVAVQLEAAYRRAYRTDPASAFGGIIAINRELDHRTAAAILERQFVEVLIAPGVASEARAALASKPNVRVLTADVAAEPRAALDYRRLVGGLLVQDRDLGRLEAASLRTVTRRAPDERQLADLTFAWQVARFVKSNAIVLARDRATTGIGAGQTSRVAAVRVAAMKATDEDLALAGCVMASDGFFPFRDGIDTAARHGIDAVIQPGGSVRDAEVIAAADERGIAMVFTGMRHFRH